MFLATEAMILSSRMVFYNLEITIRTSCKMYRSKQWDKNSLRTKGTRWWTHIWLWVKTQTIFLWTLLRMSLCAETHQTLSTALTRYILYPISLIVSFIACKQINILGQTKIVLKIVVMYSKRNSFKWSLVTIN